MTSRRVYVALGSNLSTRALFISKAISEMKKSIGNVVQISRLYQTAPQYVVDQPSFLNACVAIDTDLPAPEVLVRLKALETEIGRVASFRFGPRHIDLDLLLYGDEVFEVETSCGALIVPHPRLMERDFVLQPLCDIVSEDKCIPLPLSLLTERGWKSSFFEQLKSILFSSRSPAPSRVLALRGGQCCWELGQRTYVMGILNITPDSFSDGGELLSLADVVARAKMMEDAGCDCLDVGGESTRPGAVIVGEGEEMRRVLPAIEAIRTAGIMLPISIDTTRASVARAAINAGADLVNDISGGCFDDDMLRTVADLGVPIILMDSRGSREQMHIKNPDENVVNAIVHRLTVRSDAAVHAGIPPWNIIFDPGLGFARTQKQNLDTLKGLASIRAGLKSGCLLIGPSRKKFVSVISQAPNSRKSVIGSVAVCCAGVAGGADIVRVHDVPETVQAVRMADALWRSSSI